MSLVWRLYAGDEANDILQGAWGTLWQADSWQSPFSAPHFLQFAKRFAQEHGRIPWLLGGYSADGRLLAGWPLCLWPDGKLRFLQDEFCDHATCLATKDVSVEELAAGLNLALEQDAVTSLYLMNAAEWGPTLASAKLALRQSSWQVTAFPAWKTPVLQATPDENGYAMLLDAVNKKNLRNYANRLKRLPGYKFEVLTDDTDLDVWAHEFCNHHEFRWNQTTTPSIYRDPSQRQLLRDKLTSWCQDGSLVRFAICVDEGRIGFCIGLSNPSRLIHHKTIYSPAYHHTRAGTVLIRLIVQWMVEHQHTVLDFGTGTEDYKLRFSNNIEDVWRIYGSPGRMSRTYWAAQLDRRIREDEKVGEWWQAWVNEGIRGTLFYRLTQVRNRAATFQKVHARNPLTLTSGRLRARLGTERELFYRAQGGSLSSDETVQPLPILPVLNMLEEEITLQPIERANYFERFYGDSIPYGVIEDSRVMQMSWLRPALSHETPDDFQQSDPEGRIWCIYDCYTPRTARGRGLYGRVLKAIVGLLPPGDDVIIYTHDWNKPSKHGIEKASFQYFGMRKKTRDGHFSWVLMEYG
jgi:CelD/BcsL family acetyltransferase involved in cellulose biosynthesis